MALISGLLVAKFLGIAIVILAGVHLYFKYFLYTYWKKKGVVCAGTIAPVGILGPVILSKFTIGIKKKKKQKLEENWSFFRMIQLFPVLIFYITWGNNKWQNLNEFLGEVYADWYTKLKRPRYFGSYAFYKPGLVIADPDLIRHVLTREFNHFHDRGLYCNEKVDPLSGHLFFLAGSKWRNLRAKLTPTFTSGKIKQMFSTVVENGEKLSDYLRPIAEKREVVEFKEVIARWNEKSFLVEKRIHQLRAY